ncbi:MAG: lipid A export permease/ATP-binding protein MsbA [Aquificota bacterium]|nr:MAG: lipid A export permease/ATP-binding protein MsbA [Aquificota bacterium]
MRYYLRILSYAKPYWFRITIALIMAQIVAATDGALAWLVKPIMDRIFVERNAEMLRLIPLAIVGLYVVKGVGRYVQNYFMRYANLRMVMDLRTDLFRKIQGMSLAFHKSKSTGELISRVMSDVSVVRNANVDVIKNLIRQIFTLLALLVVLFKRDWQLAAMACVTVPFAGVLIDRLGRKIKEITKASQEKRADLSSLMVDSFSGVRIVKAFNMEEQETKRFRKHLHKLYSLSMKKVKASELVSPLIEFLGSLGAAAIIYVGGMRVITGRLTPGDFFSFMAALMMMYGPIRKLTKVNNTIQAAIAAAERVLEVLDMEPDIKDAPDAVEVLCFERSIRFDHVWFAYPDDPETWILKDIHLEVGKGEILALVGESGAGKTTLVDLVPRFYDPTKGAVYLDGVDLSKLKRVSLRALIGVVTQDVILFNDTILNNILYGRPKASFEEVIEAAKVAHAHEFIQQLPDGYETVVGERGVRLSGGQKQRIAIARAVLKNPPILILDEATSALDTQSERMVQEAMDRLMEGRTVFVIAHRLSTIQKAHRIVVLDKGRIVEMGAHQELLDKGGLYSHLYRLQFLEESEDPRKPVGLRVVGT